jgi:Protein of unknown function (DUF3048).
MNARATVRIVPGTLLLLIFCISLSACAGLSTPPVLTPAALRQVSPTPGPAQRQTQAAAAATPTPVPSPTPWTYATYTPTLPPADLPAARINPLTGLPAQDKALLDERPVLVKIANWPQNLRPAAGLKQADLVFEYYIGFQMNHLAAVFHGRDSERVGPLAPARMVDARLAEHYQGIVAYASADSTVEKIFAEVLPDRAFARGFAPCPAICTITDTTGENTFVDTAALRTHASEAKELIETIDLLGFTFDPRLSDWDADADTLSLQYADFSVMEWRFDSETDQYVLYQDFADQGSIRIVQSTDRADGSRIAFENVLVLFANYIEYNPTMYDVDFREGDPNQRALLLRDGKLIYGTWSAADPFSPINLFGKTGAPLPLKPGRTWIIFVGTTSKAAQISGSEWELVFSLQ